MNLPLYWVGIDQYVFSENGETIPSYKCFVASLYWNEKN